MRVEIWPVHWDSYTRNIHNLFSANSSIMPGSEERCQKYWTPVDTTMVVAVYHDGMLMIPKERESRWRANICDLLRIYAHGNQALQMLLQYSFIDSEYPPKSVVPQDEE